MKSPETVRKILSALKAHYPKGEKPWATKSDPFQTLIATILSAQTTDDQVDRVIPELFRHYPHARELGAASQKSVERIIRSVGLYQAKAKNIIGTGKMLADAFGGEVPNTREKLITLPGVGRKTANVVLIKSFGVPAMPVDTHVFRVANRIGIAKAKTPEQTEAQLTTAIPKKDLGAAHFWFIHHGRTLCSARNPQCPACPINRWCTYASGTFPE